MKVGEFQIPENPNRLPNILEKLKTVYDKYKREEIKNTMKNDALAQLVGYNNSTNGSYQRMVRAFRAYGFLEGRADLRITQRGENAVYGTEADKNEAVISAFLSIPLWNKLYEKFKTQLPPNDLWVDIQRISSCNPKEAQEMENSIRVTFAKDASVINNLVIPKREKVETTPQIEKDTSQKAKAQLDNLEGEELLPTLIKLGAYNIAKDLIDFLQTKNKDEKSKPTPNAETH